jgi:hypothetical protein
MDKVQYVPTSPVGADLKDDLLRISVPYACELRMAVSPYDVI